MAQHRLSEECDAAFNIDEEASLRVLPPDRDSLGPASSKSDENINNVQSNTPSRAENKTRSTLLRGWNYLRPHLGIGALCVASCCVAFSVAILISSDGAPVKSWTVRPAVYLAISSAIANSAVAFAYSQATIAAWWRTASQGATVRNSERQWQVSSSLVQTLLQLRNMNVTVAAAILVALMIADGPMLQSASRVVVATKSTQVELHFSVSPEVPTGFSGSCRDNLVSPSNQVQNVLHDWKMHVPIAVNTRPGCEGTCIGKVKAPGVAKEDCSTVIWPITREMYYSQNATWGPWSGKIPVEENLHNPIFTVHFPAHFQCAGCGNLTSEAGMLTVGMWMISNSSGNYTQTSCALVPAVRECDVAFSNHAEVQVLPNSNPNGSVLSYANNTRAPNADNLDKNFTETITSIVASLARFVEANASASAPAPLLKAGRTPWMPDLNTFNAMAMQHSGAFSSTAAGNYMIDFSDPTPYIVDQFNEIMFRAGVMAASWPDLTSLIDPGLSPHQRTLANQTIILPVFRSDYRWFAGATALELIVVLAVLTMCRSYWNIDKQLDFSPFGIALAFDAPLLRDVDRTKGTAGVVERLGDVNVRYGEVFEVADSTSKSQDKDKDAKDDAANWRLRIGRSSYVRPWTKW